MNVCIYVGVIYLCMLFMHVCMLYMYVFVCVAMYVCYFICIHMFSSFHLFVGEIKIIKENDIYLFS